MPIQSFHMMQHTVYLYIKEPHYIMRLQNVVATDYPQYLLLLNLSIFTQKKSISIHSQAIRGWDPLLTTHGKEVT